MSATRITLEHVTAVEHLATGIGVLLDIAQHAVDAHDAECVGDATLAWCESFIAFVVAAGWISDDDADTISEMVRNGT